MHPLLVGGNPFTTTSIYTLILFLEKKWGIHYSMGGTGNVVSALEKLMKEENIEIIKDAEVTELINSFSIAKTLETTEVDIINTIFAHPTLSEAIHEATAAAFNEAIHI